MKALPKRQYLTAPLLKIKRMKNHPSLAKSFSQKSRQDLDITESNGTQFTTLEVAPDSTRSGAAPIPGTITSTRLKSILDIVYLEAVKVGSLSRYAQQIPTPTPPAVGG